MSERDPQCPRCRVPMEVGYLLDRGNSNVFHRAEWVEGAPQMRTFLGLNVGLKISGRETVPVSAWRCPRCGLLESYARSQGSRNA